MGFKIILFLLIFYVLESAAVNYTVTASEKFRPDTNYKFIVTIYGESSVSYQLKARIKNNRAEVAITEAEFQVEPPGLHQVFELKIPRIVQAGQYVFEVVAQGGVVFNKSHRVQLNQKSHSLFIQTDKYLYKPGQTVLFRVLGIQPDLKPYTDNINITIYEQSNNKIYELLNQRNQSGVIGGSLKLSHITPLGRWKIEAKSETLKKEVFFEVAEYVLPKFEVKVLSPSYFFANRNNPSTQLPLHIAVTATYTFGKPVKGYALVSIKVRSGWGFTYAPSLLKHVELVDGKTDITVSVEEMTQFHTEVGTGWNYHNLFVQANVTEAATGIILQGNKTIPIKFSRYELKFLEVSSNNFKPGFLYRGHLQLSQADGSEPKLSDIRFPNGTFKFVEVQVSYFNHFYFDTNKTTPSPSTFNLTLNANGYVFFEVPIEQADDAVIRAKFYDEETQNSAEAVKNIEQFMTRDAKNIQLTIVGSDAAIRPYSTLTFDVKTSEPTPSLQYQIIGKEKLVYSDIIHFETDLNRTSFSVFVDEDMALNLAPQATIIVFYITSTGELVADSLSLSVTDYMANKVSLSINPESTSPGEEVLVRVNASQDSFVSLSAIDQSVLLLSAGNEINRKILYEDLNKYTNDYALRNDDFTFWRFCWPIWIVGSSTDRLLKYSGLFVLTNFHINIVSPRNTSIYYSYARYNPGKAGMFARVRGLPGSPPPMISFPSLDHLLSNSVLKPRIKYPETWIWSDVQVRSEGLLELKYKVPDTITSWVASAFATSNRFGLGITESSAKLTVIKPFFILLNLPYSVTRGEEFALQVTIFNYFGTDLPVTVTLPLTNYYYVKECYMGTERNILDAAAHKNIFVKDNDAVTIYFWIVPASLGQIPIEVRAVTTVAGDSLIRNLLVKPEGEQQSYSSSSLIRIPSEDLSVINFDVSLPPPEILVPDSVIIEATLIGDILGTTINNLDNLLNMPYGCGEQNMVTLAPDVYIVKYLTATNQLTEEIKNKALEFINAGYQRELTYQRTDGSFSAFGNSDEAGSVWLSAFIAKVFRDAQDFIPVDDRKMANTIRWILRHQDDIGLFIEPSDGKVLHTAMQGGASSGIGLTAYVLISLLVNKDVNIYDMEDKIKKSVSYLEGQFVAHNQDPYVLSIIGYALYLAKSPRLNNVLAILNLLAVQQGGFKHWHNSVPGEDSHSSYLKPQSNDIEMTSYVLQIYASQLSLNDAIPIAKWLISKRNPEGGFTSTQDTVLGLEALAMFGHMVSPPANAEGLDVQVTQNVNEDVHRFTRVNRETALLLQSHQLPSESKTVTFSTTGEGLALVQLNVRYNVHAIRENIHINLTLNTVSSGLRLNLDICSSWHGVEETGMILIEINLLTGYILVGDYAAVLKEKIGSIFKKAEFSNNRLYIYLDELSEICFVINFKSIFHVKNLNPAMVKIYRYYSPGVSASGYYSSISTSDSVNICDSMFNQPDESNNQVITLN